MVGNCDITGRKLKDVRHTGVLGIAIIDGYRGVGLGEQMIRAALNQATKIGIWLVELEVFANNERARQLYSKIGFKKVGTVPKKIQRNGKLIDEVVMYIHLPHR
jgi:RimJ/RimL family protein N-acetyltransferase